MQLFHPLPFSLLITFFLFNVPLAFCNQTLPQPVSRLKFLYANILLNGINEREIKVGECAGNVIYLDYSLQFNSVVAVCEKNYKIFVNIFPLDKTQPTKLKANGLKLDNLKAISTSYFAYDWSTGLLYYTEEHTIWVVDLKQPVLSDKTINYRLLEVFHSTESVMINGLVVRPEKSCLVWMMYYKSVTIFLTSSQAGKDVAKLHKFQGRLESLSYDYLSHRFLALVPGGDSKVQKGFLFHDQDIRNQQEWTSATLTGNGSVSNRVILYGEWLMFYEHKTNTEETNKNSIRGWSIRDNKTVSPDILPQKFNSDQFIFTLIDRSNVLHPPVEGSCGEGQKSMCNQLGDFCIPHNEIFYICKSNPSILREVVPEPWTVYIIIIIIFISLVMLITFIGVLIHKKQMQFYQIKLMSIVTRLSRHIRHSVIEWQ